MGGIVGFINNEKELDISLLAYNERTMTEKSMLMVDRRTNRILFATPKHFFSLTKYDKKFMDQKD